MNSCCAHLLDIIIVVAVVLANLQHCTPVSGRETGRGSLLENENPLSRTLSWSQFQGTTRAASALRVLLILPGGIAS
jgi:hypothetical protein